MFVMLIVSAILLTGCTLSLKKASPPDGGVFISLNSGETWSAKTFIGQQNKTIITIGPLDASFLVFDPKNAQKIYFVSRTNGVYRTLDRGEKWEATPLRSSTYLALVVDPSNTDVLYAAQGTTISKSIDGMKTWTTIYVESQPHETITALAIDSFNPSKIYATTQSSVLKSEDAGVTWRTLNWKGTQAAQLLISAKDSRTLYLYATNYGFYRTTDGGETWQDLSAALNAFTGSKSVLWIDFHSDTEFMALGTPYGILTSSDGAATWQPISTLFPFGSVPIRVVAVNPTNRKEIFFAVGNILHKTVDGGVTWKTIKTVPTSRTIGSLYISAFSQDVLFAGTVPAGK